MKTEIYVERLDEKGEWQELLIEIRGTYTFETPARLHGHPDTWSPAEGGETEIESAICKTEQFKHLFDALTKEEKEKAEEALIEKASEEYRSAAQDYAADLYEDSRYDD